MQSSKRSPYSALRRLCVIAALGLLAISPLLAPQVCAQVSGLPGLGQSGGGNALGGLSGGLPSVTQAGPANLAGVLQYCVQNNFLSNSVAGSTQTALLGQVPGSAQSSDFAAGSSGLLQTGNNQTYNLNGGGSGVQSQMEQQICNMVLQHAKSLL